MKALLIGLLAFSTPVLKAAEVRIDQLSLVEEDVASAPAASGNSVMEGNFPNSIMSGNFPNMVLDGNFPDMVMDGNFPTSAPPIDPNADIVHFDFHGEEQ